MSLICRCDRCSKEGAAWEVNARIRITNPSAQHVPPMRFDLCDECIRDLDRFREGFSVVNVRTRVAEEVS